jgi:uncharacterized protein (DUF1697 family)
MTCFIALLRGINVSGHRKVPMADLRALCSGLGHEDVRSYIQSGNVVFTARGKAPAIERALEQALEARFGFAVEVLVRTAEQWAGYVRDNPLRDAAEAEPNRVMLALSKAPPAATALEKLRERATQERLEAAGDALWVHFREGAGSSKLTPALWDRLVGSPVTARNWRTVQALAEMAGVTSG